MTAHYGARYESPESLIILTSAGRELAAGGGLAPLLRGYAEDYLTETASSYEIPTSRRSFLAEGGSAKVFSVGNRNLVVKEARPLGDQLLPALERMDTLINAVENHCPRWIDIPKHYGVLISKQDMTKQFLLMEKIDDGVTVGDVLHYNKQPREPHLKASVERLFHPVTEEVQKDIEHRFDQLRGHVRTALMAEYLSPDDYLPDIDHNAYNVVLEHLDTPVAGSNLKFWIIDQ